MLGFFKVFFRLGRIFSIDPLTPRVKRWVMQSFLTFDSMDRTLKCDHSLETCWAVLYCSVVCFSTQFFKVGKYVNFGLSTVRSVIALFFCDCIDTFTRYDNVCLVILCDALSGGSSQQTRFHV